MLAGIVRIVFFFFIFSVIRSVLGIFMKKVGPPKQAAPGSKPESGHSDIDAEYTVVKED